MEINKRLFLAGAVLGTLMLAVRPCGVPQARSATAPRGQEEIVVFDTRSGNYHCRGCSLVQSCGTACLLMPLSRAVARGGAPCGLCGGTCKTTGEPTPTDRGP